MASGQGAVSAPRVEAIEAGEQMLADGGTAADAAIAACFVLGVVEPYMTGLGAVGELVHLDADGRCSVVDAIGRAPLAATPEMYGEPVGPASGGYEWPEMSGRRNEVGGASVVAPRLLSGLAEAHRRFGRLPWPQVVAPAIETAENGWDLDFFTEASVFDAREELEQHSEGLVDVTYPGWPGQRPFALGGTRRQLTNSALAATLRRIAAEGEDVLRAGPVAEAIVAASQRDGGVLAEEDLRTVEAPVYEDVEPLGSFRGWSLHGSPLPSGAVTVAQILETLDRAPVRERDADWYAAFAVACGDAFDARIESLSGDASPSGAPTATTHLSVADGEGRVVSLTSTLLSLFGARTAVAGAGFYLNNGMMWFDPVPGRSNSIRPGGRALVAMSPVALVDPHGEARIALGALGGRRIPSAVAQVAAFRIEHGDPLERAVDVPRVHVEPSATHVDERLPLETHEALRARGFEPTSMVYGPLTVSLARANGVEWSRSGSTTGIDKRSRDTWRYGR